MNLSPSRVYGKPADDVALKIEALQPNQFYRIIYRTPTVHRTDRMSVLQFLGFNEEQESSSWNARPVAGTQTMPLSWILDLESVPTPINNRAKAIVIDQKAPKTTTQEPDDPDAGWNVTEMQCSNRQPHAPHLVRQGDASRERRWRVRCPGRYAPDLTSGSKGEQWQAQMEDFIASARGAGNEAMRLMNQPQAMRDPIVEKQVRFRVGVAQAHAQAALALAIVNAIGDLEPVLGALAHPIVTMESAD